MRRLRLYITLSVFAIIAGALGFGVAAKLSREEAEPAARPSGGGAVAVEVEPVERGSIRDIRRLTGTVSASSSFVAAPKISGRLQELMVDIGDVVERGQVIARLEDDELLQTVLEARSEVAVTRARLEEAQRAVEIAQREFDRFRELGERGAVSQSNIDAARMDLVAKEAQRDVAEAQLARQEATLRSADIRLSYTEITADWREEDRRRVVGERFADEGDLLSANAPLVRILDIDSVRVVTYVTERDYTRLRLGQETEVSAEAFPDVRFRGVIRRLAPQFRESSRQARVEIDVENPEHRLKPGMFVRVEVLLEEKHNATIIPFNALANREGEKGVFLVDEEEMTVRFVVIEPGIQEGRWVEVRRPAELTGRVVTLGQNRLGEGSSITIPGGDIEVSPESSDEIVAERLGG